MGYLLREIGCWQSYLGLPVLRNCMIILFQYLIDEFPNVSALLAKEGRRLLEHI